MIAYNTDSLVEHVHEIFLHIVHIYVIPVLLNVICICCRSLEFLYITGSLTTECQDLADAVKKKINVIQTSNDPSDIAKKKKKKKKRT